MEINLVSSAGLNLLKTLIGSNKINKIKILTSKIFMLLFKMKNQKINLIKINQQKIWGKLAFFVLMLILQWINYKLCNQDRLL